MPLITIFYQACPNGIQPKISITNHFFYDIAQLLPSTDFKINCNEILHYVTTKKQNIIES